MTPLPVHDTREGTRFLVRVTPRASRTAIVGVHGDGSDAALKIALQAPPVEGRANAALIEFLAACLDVPRSAVEIGAGERSRYKAILLRGRSAAEIKTAIERTMAAAHK